METIRAQDVEILDYQGKWIQHPEKSLAGHPYVLERHLSGLRWTVLEYGQRRAVGGNYGNGSWRMKAA